MPSFKTTISPTRRAAARFIATVRRALQQAYVEEYRKRGLTQSEIARELKIHRSVINRELRGEKDLTLGRVGELAYVLGRKPTFAMPVPVAKEGSNITPPSQVSHSTSGSNVQPLSQPNTTFGSGNASSFAVS